MLPARAGGIATVGFPQGTPDQTALFRPLFSLDGSVKFSFRGLA
jgi:hypothetical protein